MAKFVMVDEAPPELRKGEFVIQSPDFLDEIRANAKMTPRSGRTGTNQLRAIVGSIGAKYDPNITAWNIRPHLYEDRTFANEQELSAIIVDLLRTQQPRVFDSYLEHQIKNRPQGVKVIYYVGSFADTGAFNRNGIDQMNLKDVDVELNLKAKKVVGKPAVTDDEANTSGE